ncbi:SpoIIE family protein phosphatase [Streptomyces sp. NPDC056683]|uniref:SpoIIE family protein phosphatase n=1 Tax=Streptomyces sp. NPDC056683 TaxID=3345910 RepID=UPI0036895334
MLQGSLCERLAPQEAPDAAIAMTDAEGTVVGWTSTAQRLVGYPATEVVGRAVSMLLPLTRETLLDWASAEECRARGGWSGTATVRHRDGHTLKASLRFSLLWGTHGEIHWLISGTDIASLSPVATTGWVRDSLLTRTPIGVVVHDRDLHCAWTNDAMERQDGIPRDQRLGRRLPDVLPGTEAEGLDKVMRRVLDSGVSTVREYRVWPPADPRHEHAIAASYFCLQDADGRAVGVCCTSVDVTLGRRARERLAILSEAGTRMGNSLDVMRIGQELADLAVPLLADYVNVDLAESIQFGEAPFARIGPLDNSRPVLRRAGLASIRPGVPESPWACGELVAVPRDSPFTKVLSSGRAHLEPVLDASPGTWFDRDPDRARTVRESGMHSLMVVPIRARHAFLGTAVFIRTEETAPFQEDDLLLAEGLVSRTALSLDNARRYARERSAALTLQRNLLPQRLVQGTAIETASRYLPADVDNGVGGDWFDAIPLPGARTALVVGDVVGHGINAAATMGRLRTAVQTLADLDLPPDELLTHLDDTVRRMAAEDADSQDPTRVTGATCLYAVYDPVTQRCTMARAGHPPPAVIDPHGNVTFPDLPTGTPLGVGVGIPFEAVELELPEGSRLALYTDGLIESREHDIEAGMRRLGAALAHPGRSLERLCSSVIEAVPTHPPGDDVALLVARTHALSPSRTTCWVLPADPAVVHCARTLVTRRLVQWGLERLVPSTQLIISELVTNAVRHAAGPIRLRLIRHQVLTCEVSDTSDTLPRLRHACPSDEGGRGLYIVAQLCRRHGARCLTNGGKTVWAEQDLDPGA